MRLCSRSSYRVTVNLATLSTPFRDAEIVTLVFVSTGLVVNGTTAELAPPGIVTLVGSCANLGLLVLRVTTKPAGGAVPVSVMVACEEKPPLTVAGFRVTADRVGLGSTPLVNSSSSSRQYTRGPGSTPVSTSDPGRAQSSCCSFPSPRS